MRFDRILAAAAMLGLSGTALAGSVGAIPEPETLALLAIGAAAIAVARWRRK